MYLPSMHPWAEGDTLRDHLAQRGISRRAFLEFCGGLAVVLGLPRSAAGQVAQALPTLLVVRIQDEKPRFTLLVEQIGAQRDLTPQVVKQEAHVQGLTNADIAAIVKLVGVQIPALDKLPGQHQGWAREFRVRE